MKLLLVLVAGCLLQVAKGYAQKISVHVHKEPLLKVVLDVIHKYGYVSMPDASLFLSCATVTDNFDDLEIEQAMARLFRGQPVTDSLAGNVFYFRPADLRGQVVDDNDEPIPGVTITSSRKGAVTVTDDKGHFTLRAAALDSFLDLTAVNAESLHFQLNAKPWQLIRLRKKFTPSGEPVEVWHTGYRSWPKERATGSFSLVTSTKIACRPSPNLGLRLDNQAPGVVVLNTDIGLTSPFPEIIIRGKATLLADPRPLIVVDRFTWNSNLNQINPNDVESVTILKDAAASSIWGARAGNGVMVFTTKQGKYNQKPQLSFSTQLSVWHKYNSQALPALSPASTLDLESKLFNQHHYDLALFTGSGFVSPGVELLWQQRMGMLDSTQTAAARATLAGHDVRDDIDAHFYRPTIAQQYHLSLQGGDEKNRYYLSAGYDKLNNGLTQGTQYRHTLTGNYTYKPWKAFEINLGTALNITGARNDIPSPRVGYRYASLVNPDGTPATVSRDRPQLWKDTQGLPDWNYRPLDEQRLRDDSLYRLQTRLALNLAYTVAKGLKLQVAAQYLDERSDHHTKYPIASYTYRNLYNRFAYQTANGFASYVPEGPVTDLRQTHYRATNLRGQVDYTHTWPGKWELTALAGMEVARATADTSSRFRYNKEVDYNASYPLYKSFQPPAPLPGKPYTASTFDYYRSWFGNAGLVLHDRYIFTVSARADQSNLFGADTNAQTQPLWSTGLKWIFTKERFCRIYWLGEASLRASYGLSGNIDRSVSALLTVDPAVINQYGDEVRTIRNAPNPSLQWETSPLFNIALDFRLNKKQLFGTLEYYHRRGNKLLWDEQTRTTSGGTIYRNNATMLTADGFELQLNAHLVFGKWQWNSGLLLAYTTNKILRIDTAKQKLANYLDPAIRSFLIGQPMDALYALHTAPLDPSNGDPWVYLDGKSSADYAAILASSPANLRYMGHSTPPLTAAFSQSISYKGFALSAVIAARLGYYYRRPSIDYSGFTTGANMGHPDYDLRWQKPGDEAVTSVPSFPAFVDPNRDFVYSNSDKLVERADNIRLRELRLSWTLEEKAAKKKLLSGATVFMYGANLGILWKASKYDLDPDAPSAMPFPKSFSIGIRFDLQPTAKKQ